MEGPETRCKKRRPRREEGVAVIPPLLLRATFTLKHHKSNPDASVTAEARLPRKHARVRE